MMQPEPDRDEVDAIIKVIHHSPTREESIRRLAETGRYTWPEAAQAVDYVRQHYPARLRRTRYAKTVTVFVSAIIAGLTVGGVLWIMLGSMLTLDALVLIIVGIMLLVGGVGAYNARGGGLDGGDGGDGGSGGDGGG
jgi:uncharacterized membrane protein YgcG